MSALICLSCGTQNPAINRFCGQCGTQLEQATETREQLWREVAACAAAGSTSTTTSNATSSGNLPGAAPVNSGPTEPPHKFHIVIEPPNPVSINGSDYDDEEHKPSHLLRNIAICVIAVAAVLAALQWRSIRDYGLRQFGLAPFPDGITASSPANAGASNSSTFVADNAIPVPGQPAAANVAASAPPASDPNLSAAASARAMAAPAAESSESQSRAISNQPATFRPDRTAIPGDYEMSRAAHSKYEEDRAAWLWKAVAKGNPQARIKLASMYVQGSGVDRNCDQAQVLLSGAAKEGNQQAKLSLEQIRLQGACPQ